MEVALEAELRATMRVAIRRISTLIPAQRLRRASHACVSPWWQQAVTTVVNCSNHLTRSASVLKFDACSTLSSSSCHPLEAEAEVEVEVEAKLEAEVEAEAELEADVEVEAEAELEAKLEAEVEVEVEAAAVAAEEVVDVVVWSRGRLFVKASSSESFIPAG